MGDFEDGKYQSSPRKALLEKGFRDKVQRNKVDWFTFENHIWEMIANLVVPYQVWCEQGEKNVQLMLDKMVHHNWRIEEMEFVVWKSQQHSSSFEDIKKSLFEMETDYKNKFAHVETKIEELKIAISS